jgi:hypothetical protein
VYDQIPNLKNCLTNLKSLYRSILKKSRHLGLEAINYLVQAAHNLILDDLSVCSPSRICLYVGRRSPRDIAAGDRRQERSFFVDGSYRNTISLKICNKYRQR